MPFVVCAEAANHKRNFGSGYAMTRTVAQYDQHIHKSVSAIREVCTAIVPGACVYSDGRLSHMLEDSVTADVCA